MPFPGQGKETQKKQHLPPLLEDDVDIVPCATFARDVIFEHIHRIPAPRLTEDIDIGFEVASWEEFHRLTSILIERGLFAATRLPHRFTGVTRAAIIDIAPYGGISDEMKRIKRNDSKTCSAATT